MGKAVTRVRPQVNLNLKEPPLYKVIYFNDDVTTMEFVIESLIGVFNYTIDEAAQITQKIHENGSSAVATLPYEMAEQKGVEVTQLARANGFPLVIKLEPAE